MKTNPHNPQRARLVNTVLAWPPLKKTATGDTLASNPVTGDNTATEVAAHCDSTATRRASQQRGK